MVTKATDTLYRIYTYVPSKSEYPKPAKGITGLHNAPVFTWGSLEMDGQHHVYSKCVGEGDETRKICFLLRHEGAIVFHECDGKCTVAKAIFGKSTGIPAVFLNVAEGVDKLAMVVLTACAADIFHGL